MTDDDLNKTLHAPLPSIPGPRRHQMSHTSRASLLRLPASIHQMILQELDECSLKNMSLTCSRFLLSIEGTFEHAPKLHVSDRTNQVTDTVRIITESKNGQLFESPIDPLHPTPVLYKSYSLQIFQSNTPTYDESSTQTQPDEFRRRRRLNIKEEKIWLCPHVGCTLDDLDGIPFAGRFTTRDMVLAGCVFPKCALWARHAIVETWRETPSVHELCSVFRIYRTRYSKGRAKCVRQMLSNLSHDKVQDALKHLRMPICRHLELGSQTVTDMFDPEQIPIFADTREGRECYPFFSPNIDEKACKDCLAEGTYTTWGFWARLTKSEASTGGASWIDIEMTLSRPFHAINPSARRINNDAVWISDPHWRAHCLQENDAMDFVDGWWKWAGKIADEGFDWRARLPTHFLQINKSALINFPQLPPSYEEHDPDHKAKVWNVVGLVRRLLTWQLPSSK